MIQTATPNQITIRGLLEELHEEIRRADGCADDLSTSVFGPRPSDAGGDKDPRSDMRSLIERILTRSRKLNETLAVVNNGIGVPNRGGVNQGLVGNSISGSGQTW